MVLAASSKDEKEKWFVGLQTSILPTSVSSIFREQVSSLRLSPSPSSPSLSRDSTSMSSISSSTSSFSPSSSSSTIYPDIAQEIPSPSMRNFQQLPEPIEHNIVPRIHIEERYIFTTPTPKQLERKAKRLHKALYQRFPNQANIVVYEFDNSKPKRGFRLFHLGYIDVYRSLDLTSTQMATVQLPSDDSIHDAQVVNSPPTMYALLKIQPFLHKLQLLDQELIEKLPANKVLLISLSYITS